LLGRDTIVADREVDVAEAMLVGEIDVGSGTVDGDDGPHAEFVERTKPFFIVRTTTTQELVGKTEDVVQAGGLDRDRKRR
jgi:hypothetical protein